MSWRLIVVAMLLFAVVVALWGMRGCLREPGNRETECWRDAAAC